ncbi:MAG: PAS domain S-box protein [Ignavibacteriaceae bacterium]|nr:PAS domain S-box protein [Ignavibacteriaceae bacterium]
MKEINKITNIDPIDKKGTEIINTLYSTAFENLSEPIIVTYKSNILICNTAFRILFGYKSSEEIIDRSLLDFISPTHREKLYDVIFRDPKIEENFIDFETKGIKKCSTEFDIELKVKYAEHETEIYEIISIKDLSEKKLVKDQINKLSRIVDQSSSMIMITDPNGMIEYTNPKFSEVTGFDPEEVFGQKTNFLKSGYHTDEDYKEMWERISEGKDWRGEFKNKKKNGDYYWEHCVITPIKNDNGDIQHILAIKDDITNSKEMEFELKRALDTAEEASKLKSNLLSNMSHELRTPLTGIIGFSSLLRDELIEEDHIEIVDKILKSGKRLLVTLNSVLNLSEIESGTFPITLSECNLASFTRYLLVNYDKMAAEKNLNFNFDVIDEEINVMIDETLFKQILMHITDNALKFTNEGSITIQISSERNELNEVNGIVKIIDTGIGIDSSDQQKIFREFRQISEGIRRNFEGNGLGLAVAKKMALLMKGDIKVNSKINVGSEFSIILPGVSSIPNLTTKAFRFNREISKKTAPPKERPLPRVLSVEDNPLNNELVNLFLRKVCNVDTALNYDQAIEKIKSNMYETVLIDINLGAGPTGLDLANEIKKIEHYRKVPLIALTGYALLHDDKKLMGEGFDHYLSKPYEREDLINLVLKVINY